MKIRNLIIPVFVLGFILSLLSLPCFAAQKKKQEEKAQESKPVFIPQEVKSVFEEGIKTRQARLDIPFTIIKHLFLPAIENMHSIFLFKVKNVDLGFYPIAPTPEIPEKKEKKEEEKEALPESEIIPAKLQSNSRIFLQFNKLEGNELGEVVKEIYIPFNFQVESGSYEPDKEELYTTAYTLPPGNYILSMAITSLNYEKIGTQYFEFSLPNPSSFTDNLDTTPLFIVQNVKRMDSAELKPEIHKDFFTWSVLQIRANLERSLSSGEIFELFFYIFGVQTSEDGKYNIEVNYEVLKGEETAIRFSPPGIYDLPLVSQPLHLKKPMTIKSEEGERKETRDLEPGKYTLSIKITDKISGKSVTKTIDFEVK
ncbi:MAG: hypothetical protein ABIJ30_06695 [bacterium]